MGDDSLKMNIPYPVPTPHHAAVLGAYHLTLELAGPACEVRVPGRPGALFLEDWEVTRAAFLARMTSTLRHLGYLIPSMSRLDGAALCRTLLDHVITYAWIAHDPGDRLPRFLRDTYHEALKHHERFAGLDEDLLTPELEARYRAHLDAYGGTPGGLRQIAEAADADWLARLQAAAPSPLQVPSFERLYIMVYGPFANLDHPSTAGLQTFVRLDPTGSAAWVDGDPERDRDMDMRPYWLALWSFISALTVASLSQGRPRLTDLQKLVQRVRAVREFDRHDLLRPTVADGIISLGLVDDADARIAEIEAARVRPNPS